MPSFGQPARAADGDLDGAVATAEDAEPLACEVDARADERDDRGEDRAERQAAESRLCPLGQSRTGESALGGGERRGKRRGQNRDRHREQRVQQQVPRHELKAGRVGEQRRLAEDRDDHGVRHDAGEHRRDQGVGFEAVAVKELDRQERGAERRAKDRCDARGDACNQEDASLACAHSEQSGDCGADRRADLHGRTFTATGATGAEREQRGKRLQPDHARPDDAAATMKGVQHGIGASAAHFGREAREQAACEPARCRQQHQHPGSKSVRVLAGRELLAMGAQHGVSGQAFEQRTLQELERGEERRADQPRAEPHECGVEQHAARNPKIQRRRLRKYDRQDRDRSAQLACRA